MGGLGDLLTSIEHLRELIPPPERPALEKAIEPEGVTEEHLRHGYATELWPG